MNGLKAQGLVVPLIPREVDDEAGNTPDDASCGGDISSEYVMGGLQMKLMKVWLKGPALRCSALTTSNESRIYATKQSVSEMRYLAVETPPQIRSSRTRAWTKKRLSSRFSRAMPWQMQSCVLDEGWVEVVIRETTEFELESGEGRSDVTNGALFFP